MTQNRRSFLKQSFVAGSAAAFIRPRGDAPDARFVHHGLYWFKDKDDKDSYARVVAALKQLRKIPTVRFLHVGAPSISDIAFEARATDATYTLSYLVLFNSREDKEAYLHHPLHIKFVKDFGPPKEVISKVVIYDSMSIPD